MSMSIFTVLMPLQSFNQGQALGQMGQGGASLLFWQNNVTIFHCFRTKDHCLPKYLGGIPRTPSYKPHSSKAPLNEAYHKVPSALFAALLGYNKQNTILK